MTATATRTQPDLDQRVAAAMERVTEAATAHAVVLKTHDRGSEAEKAAALRWNQAVRAWAALDRQARGRAGR